MNVFLVAPEFTWMTDVRLLGGTLGGAATPLALIRSRLEGPSLHVPGSLASTDLLVQPVQLGWETPRADVVAGYTLFLPTGEWSQGGEDNAGLGMWSRDLQAGATLRLDARRAWTLWSLATYELHANKRGTDVRVDDILTVEGGSAGRSTGSRARTGAPSRRS